MENKMDYAADLTKRKEILKDIILKLHKGLSLEDAKDRFEKEIGDVTSGEIIEMEQSLINEGITPDEIKKFCNVHALLFEKSLRESTKSQESSSHPIRQFKLENREIEKITKQIRDSAAKKDAPFEELKKRIKDFLGRIEKIKLHYERKEQLLFPFLEKHGFFGPSKVMWGKHNEIRQLMKKCMSEIEPLSQDKLGDFIKDSLFPFIDEVDGMIFKEENILYPTSIEKLTPDEWIEIIKESAEIGYAFIESSAETSKLIEEFKRLASEEPEIKEGWIISMPTGSLHVKTFMHMLDSLPIDITFVDKDDTVKYFSNNKNRIFTRTKSVIGRKVQNCHPPQSVDKVEEIIKSFRGGESDSADFRINMKGKFIYIRYFAVRDENRNYLGTLEVTQDIGGIKNLKGEKRLLDEKN